MKKVMTGLISILVLSVSGCGSDRTNDPVEISSDNLNVALEQAIDNSVIPAVDAFNLSATQFKLSADGFCSDVSEVALQSLQAQWKDLFNKWYRLLNYNFGPLDNDLIFPRYTFIDSLRLRGTNYLGTARSEIASDVASSTVLSDEYFAAKTFQRVGLLVLESAIFETASGDNSKDLGDVVGEYQGAARKCVVLKGLAHQIVVHSENIQTGWKTRFEGGELSYRGLFLNAQLEDGTEPLTLLITSVQGYLDYLQQRNVVSTAATLSESAWDGISASIEEIETLLEGTEDTSFSFLGLMEASGFQVGVESVRANIAEVKESIARQDADMLDIALGKLDGNFKREIPDGLEVELGINFSDGD